MTTAGREGSEPRFPVTSSFWLGRRVFVTGNTGFKGAWLTYWLALMGAEVWGYSLAPENDRAVFCALSLQEFCRTTIADIRDYDSLRQAILAARPEVVFHLAAQPLVRRSYRDPIETLSTNVLGTANVLEACRASESIRTIVVVTSDKCYAPGEGAVIHNEEDRLGGSDPYSISKACAELIVSSFRSSFFANQEAVVLASARAGNVFGGGDWSEDRLIPDAMRAFSSKSTLEIRHPNAIRPWQFVLDALGGYLMLARACFQEGKSFGGAWNFGPDPHQAITVAHIVTTLTRGWGADATWAEAPQQDAPHEEAILLLDSSKARHALHWSPKNSLESDLAQTVEWYRAQLAGASSETIRELSTRQIGL